MSPKRVLAVALLVAAAGCAGVDVPGGVGNDATAPTTASDTVEPHTAVGTSHVSDHLTVGAWHDAEGVTVALGPEGDAKQFAVRAGEERLFTREVHNRGHDVRVVIERDGEVVYEASVAASEHCRITVRENETTRTKMVA